MAHGFAFYAPELRPFSPEDWDAFAGAERFTNGDKPLLFCREDTDALVVVAKDGIEIFFLTDGETDEAWALGTDALPGQETGRRIAGRQVPQWVTPETLGALKVEGWHRTI
jgi:hypothetical protein